MSVGVYEAVPFDTVDQSLPIEQLLKIPRVPAYVGSIAVEDREAFSTFFLPTRKEGKKHHFFAVDYTVDAKGQLVECTREDKYSLYDDVPEFMGKILLAQARHCAEKRNISEDFVISTYTEVKGWSKGSIYAAREQPHFDAGEDIYIISDNPTVFYADSFDMTDEQYHDKNNEAMQVLREQASIERSMQPDPYDIVSFDYTLPHASPDHSSKAVRTLSRTGINIIRRS